VSVDRLSPQQRAFWDAFGFVHLRGLFRAEATQLADAFDAIFAAHAPSMVISSDDDVLQRTPRAATRTYRHIIAPDFVERSPVLKGPPRRPARARRRREPARRAGHLSRQRRAPVPLRHVVALRRLRLAARSDDAEAQLLPRPPAHRERAIRVIPGTHDHTSQFARRLQETLYRAPEGIREEYGVDAEAIPSWAVETDPGDVLVWSFRTFHASFHGRERRRGFFLTFSTTGERAG
jgi:hypothetical protein